MSLLTTLSETNVPPSFCPVVRLVGVHRRVGVGVSREVRVSVGVSVGVSRGVW